MRRRDLYHDVVASERVRILAAMRIDPDDVAEIGEAVRARASPTAVTHAAHWRVDLVVDRYRVDVDDQLTQ